MRLKSLKALLFITLVFPCISQAQEMLDGVIAVVDNEIILHSEVMLNVREEIMRLQLDPAKVAEIIPDLYKDAIERLVEMKVVVVKAKEDSIVVSEDEVNQRLDMELAAMEQQFGSREEMERRYNTTYRKIRELRFKQLRELLLAQRLSIKLREDITVSRKEVEDFFEKYQDSTNVIIPVKEAYELSHIMKYVKPAGKTYRTKYDVLESISNRVKASEDFDALADEYRNDTKTGIISSDIGWVDKGMLNPEFENAVTALDSGGITDVIRTTLVPNQTFGFHIIKNLGDSDTRFHAKHIFFSHSIAQDDMDAYVDSLNTIKAMSEDSTAFSELAKKYSDDTETKENGGYMGEFEIDHGLFTSIPEFREVVKKMNEGEVSDVFRTQFGYHIVFVSKVIRSRKRELERDWEFISTLKQGQKADIYFEEWLKNARNDLHIEYKPIPAEYRKGEDK
ncbi:peptidylprolyl isomerase [candidate division KSB1 bacterium]